MSSLTLEEYKTRLANMHYKINPVKLEKLTNRLSVIDSISLSAIKKKILSNLKDQLQVETMYDMYLNPDYESNDEIYLDVYLGFSSLRFSITNNFRLILIEELWYNRGAACEDHEIIIGDPSIENIINTINIFKTKGRGDCKLNPSMSELII